MTKRKPPERGDIKDAAMFVQPHVYREIPTIDWGPIAGPAREYARRRIAARESEALAACCVR